MKNKIRLLKFVILFLLSHGGGFLFSQSNEELYKQGLQCKSDYKYDEGLQVFQKLLKSDSSNANYLAHASCFYCKVGNNQPTEEARMNYFHTAEYLAKKAIKTDNNNAEAHYNYALALGRINENASTSQKIANAKLIKAEAEKAIQLNPKHAGAYHILGRWHREIAGMSVLQKMAVNTLFGGVPAGASYEEAVKAFQNAILIEPKYMLHQYELAETYRVMGNKAFAKVWAEKAMQCPVMTEDDKKTLQKCKDLLNELK
jgi:tetratricopeptide (TPR) repeat protein